MDSGGSHPTIQPLDWHRLDDYRLNYLLSLPPQTARASNQLREGASGAQLIKSPETRRSQRWAHSDRKDALTTDNSCH